MNRRNFIKRLCQGAGAAVVMVAGATAGAMTGRKRGSMQATEVYALEQQRLAGMFKGRPMYWQESEPPVWQFKGLVPCADNGRKMYEATWSCKHATLTHKFGRTRENIDSFMRYIHSPPTGLNDIWQVPMESWKISCHGIKGLEAINNA